MSLSNLGLGFVFTARDQASGVLRGVRDQFIELEDQSRESARAIETRFTEASRGLALLGAGLATVSIGLAAANQAGDFEAAIAAVGAVSGAGAEELRLLEAAAIDAGIATQFDPTEAVLGLRELAQAGFNARESIGLLVPVLDLAAGSLGELSPQQAAGLAAQAIKAFGLTIDEAAVSVDRLLEAVNVFALSAGELPLALGIASRGAQALNQTLSETVIALGLVKNVIPTVERSATAAAVAMERLADPEVRAQLRGIGVDVTDSADRFRPFLDILGDMIPALERMSEAKRTAFLLDVFGREALAGVNAIMTQVTDGIRSNTGETLRGADAIAYLRTQFENAEGTAAQFRDRLLETFEGQKKLLGGSLKTLAITVGQGFADTLRPIVAALVDAVNALLKVIRAIPAPIKAALAKVVLLVGGFLTLAGAFAVLRAGSALLARGLGSVGLSLGGITSSLLPMLGIFGLVGLAVSGFAVAFRRDVGGLASFAQGAFGRIRLFFQAMAQLFSDGGFSGAVRDELARAESSGLKQFAIRVFQIVHRIRAFFAGIAEGFRAAIDAARPIFEGFVNALRRLGEALGLVASEGANAAAAIPTSEFASAGQVLGEIFGKIATVVAEALRIVTEVLGGIIEGIRGAFETFRPVFEAVGDTISFIIDKLGGLLDEILGTSDAAGESESVWHKIGEVLGWVAGIIGTVLAAAFDVIGHIIGVVIDIIKGLIAAVKAVGRWIGDLVHSIYTFFTEDIPSAFRTVVNFIKAPFVAIARFFRKIWEVMKDVFKKTVETFIRIGNKIQGDILTEEQIQFVLKSWFGDSDEKVNEAVDPDDITAPRPADVSPSTALARVGTAMPAVDQVKATSREGLDDAETKKLLRQAATQPVQANVTLNIDGEKVAQATVRAQRKAAVREFRQVPQPP